MKNYIVIGNGVAGANAVEEIRKIDSKNKITIFTEENYSFYYRPRLPEFLAGKITLDKFTMRKIDDYKNWGVDLNLNTKITSIDVDKKTVTNSKGIKYQYDALLIASGANANIPPLPGNNKKNIFTLRSVEDALKLKEAAKSAKKAILIGGGLLGLEAGYGLIQLGLKVEVIEFSDRLLPRQMDERGAQFLQKKLESMGFSFRLNAKVKEVTGDDKASGIKLEDGKDVNGDFILFSAGIRPNLDLAKSINLDIDKCIKVDEFMKTSIADIWAAGDAAEFKGIPSGLWTTGLSMGKIAGTNMAGEKTAYKPAAPSTSLKVAGVDLVSTGNIDADNKLQSAICEKGSDYRKIILENGIIKGFIFLGNNNGVKQCTSAMNKAKDVANFFNEMQKAEFDFSKLE